MISKPRIVIEMDGGLVQGVYADTDVEVLVVDRDTEGLESGRIDIASDGKEASINIPYIKVATKRVKAEFETWQS